MLRLRGGFRRGGARVACVDVPDGEPASVVERLGGASRAGSSSTISPGSTATEMLVDVQARGDVESIVRGRAESDGSVSRSAGSPTRPPRAALAVFHAGEGGRHITGQDMAVNGGQTTV